MVRTIRPNARFVFPDTDSDGDAHAERVVQRTLQHIGNANSAAIKKEKKEKKIPWSGILRAHTCECDNESARCGISDVTGQQTSEHGVRKINEERD